MTRSRIPKSKAKTAYALLGDVCKLILAEPKRYHQGETVSDNRHGHLQTPSCGTIGCVAGWVLVLKLGRDAALSFDWAPTTAQEILGLSDEQAVDLFHSQAAGDSPQTLSHAKRGARHIERFRQEYANQLKATRV